MESWELSRNFLGLPLCQTTNPPLKRSYMNWDFTEKLQRSSQDYKESTGSLVLDSWWDYTRTSIENFPAGNILGTTVNLGGNKTISNKLKKIT